MKNLLVIQRGRNLGWMSPDEVRRGLASGQIESDALWTDEVNWIKPGKTVHDYSLSELTERARFESFCEESPFQDLAMLLAYDTDFTARKARGALDGTFVAKCLLRLRLGMCYASKVPWDSKPVNYPTEELWGVIAEQLYSASPDDFDLIPNGLEKTIHAEFRDDTRVEQIASTSVEKLRAVRPELFRYAEDPYRSGRVSIRWSTARCQPVVESPVDIAKRKHLW